MLYQAVRTFFCIFLFVSIFVSGFHFYGVYHTMRYGEEERAEELVWVSAQRNQLLLEKRSLQKDVRRKRRDLQQYEDELRSKVAALSSIIKETSEFGELNVKGAGKKSHTTAIGGAGGLELEGLDTNHLLDHYISTLKGLPLGVPVKLGRISSHFGKRRSPFTGRLTRHQGVDFALRHGSSVYATANGVVKSVRFNSTYGRVIDLEHQNGVITRYAHLSKSLVKNGDLVIRGDEIGKVGSTGRSTGPHLHYEVRVEGKAINPIDTLTVGKKLGTAID